MRHGALGCTAIIFRRQEHHTIAKLQKSQLNLRIRLLSRRLSRNGYSFGASEMDRASYCYSSPSFMDWASSSWSSGGPRPSRRRSVSKCSKVRTVRALTFLVVESTRIGVRS